jgi:hypothetical protein
MGKLLQYRNYGLMLLTFMTNLLFVGLPPNDLTGYGLAAIGTD